MLNMLKKVIIVSGAIFSLSAQAAVFNCPSVVTDVIYNYGTYKIISTKPSGADNDVFRIPQSRSYLIGQALQAQADGSVYTIVVEHTPEDPSGDTRCSDNNEALQALAITK